MSDCQGELVEGAYCDLRDKVFAIEQEINKFPQLKMSFEHYFVPGVCIRQMSMPKGSLIVGKIHKYKQFHWLMKGELKVLMGDRIEHLIAPCIMISEAGAKRIAYALEDTVWLMALGTYETDIDKIEDHFVTSSEQEWLEFSKREPLLPFG